jgi:hypothetical protein
VLVAVMALVVAGCDSDHHPESSTAPSAPPSTTAKQAAETGEQLEMEGDFFSGEALTEGAVELGKDFKGVPCAGAATHELYNYEHPKIVRGQVVAPQGQLAENFLWDLLVPSAHAVPVGGEGLVEGATVRIARWTEGGVVTLDQPAATTDALGRFCLRLPSHLSPGPRLLLEASHDGGVLRRFLYDKADANISTATETLVRMVTSDHDPSEISRAELINLHTVAFTQLDTLSPVTLLADADIERAVQTLRQTLRTSDRVRRRLDALGQ